MQAELGLAYGLIQSSGQGGSFAAFYGAPYVVHWTHNYVHAYWIAVALALSSLCALYVAFGIERASVYDEDAYMEADRAQEAIKASAQVRKKSSASSEPGAAAQYARVRTDSQGSSKSVSLDGESHGYAIGNASGTAQNSSVVSLTPPQLTLAGTPSHAPQRRGSRFGVACCTPERCSWLQRPWARKLGLHHLVSLSSDFWMVLVGIATYSGCFYTFLVSVYFVFRVKARIISKCNLAGVWKRLSPDKVWNGDGGIGASGGHHFHLLHGPVTAVGLADGPQGRPGGRRFLLPRARLAVLRTHGLL